MSVCGWVSVLVCICVWVCTCMHLYMYLSACVCVCLCACPCLYVCGWVSVLVCIGVCVSMLLCLYMHANKTKWLNMLLCRKPSPEVMTWHPQSQTYLWRVVEVETREQPVIHKAQVGRVELDECRHDLVIHIHWVLPNKTSTVHTLNHAFQQNIHSMHPKSCCQTKHPLYTP